MSFSTVLIFLLLSSFLAAIADHFILSPRLKPFHQGLETLWTTFNDSNAKDLTFIYNSLFCDLFDLVYGEKMFSRRRLITSTISSISAYFILFSLTYYITVYAYSGDLASADMTSLSIGHIFSGLFSIAVLNLIPDFISLAETRLVLRWSKNCGLLGMSFFIVIDIIFTFVVFFVFGVVATLFFIVDGSGYLGMSVDKIPDMLIGLDGGDLNIIFFVSLATTFFTSFFWICFVVLFILTRVAYRFFPFTKFLYEQIAQSGKPITAVAGFFNIIFLIVWSIAWSLQ